MPMRGGCDRRYLALAAGTISLIQLSCVIEELIFYRMPGFHFFWFVALVELLIFTMLGHASSNYQRGMPVLALPRRLAGPLHLYAVVGLSLAAGTGLGKLAYKHLNFATGTVLKSMKLLPVMALSVCWLQRRFNSLQVGAAVLMVASASLFGLGEREVEPNFHPMGILLSLGCLLSQALQNTASDRLLRDHAVDVHEAMALSNGFGFVATLLITVATGELVPAIRFFSRSVTYWGLLVVRCVLFWGGAVFYTMLVREGGAASAVFVTTMRKALTVLVSFLVFPKPWTHKYTLGGVALLAAVVCEYRGKDSGAERKAQTPAAGEPSSRYYGFTSEMKSLDAEQEEPLRASEHLAGGHSPSASRAAADAPIHLQAGRNERGDSDPASISCQCEHGGLLRPRHGSPQAPK